MKKFILIFIMLIFIGSVEAKTTIEFKAQDIYFRITKMPNELEYKDDSSTQILNLKSCNNNQVNELWARLVSHCVKIYNSDLMLTSEDGSEAWLKYDGVYSKVFKIEPAYSFFLTVPSRVLALFLESQKSCKN